MANAIEFTVNFDAIPTTLCAISETSYDAAQALAIRTGSALTLAKVRSADPYRLNFTKRNSNGTIYTLDLGWARSDRTLHDHQLREVARLAA